jgi:hypothetical protein
MAPASAQEKQALLCIFREICLSGAEAKQRRTVCSELLLCTQDKYFYIYKYL